MDEITVEKFNEVRHTSFDILWKIKNDLLKLVCNICKSEVDDQRHMDDSRREHKIQVICSNSKCRKVDYRYE